MRTSDENLVARDSSSTALMWFFVPVFALLLLLLFWPVNKQFIAGLATPPSVSYLGLVRETSFLGDISIRTQVKTETRTVLVRGAVEIDIGTAVERRVTATEDLLCNVGSNDCREILSR
jgi:hypothetical protein